MQSNQRKETALPTDEIENEKQQRRFHTPCALKKTKVSFLCLSGPDSKKGDEALEPQVLQKPSTAR